MNERVKELDGIRGVAVIAVIALHTFSRADQFTNNYMIESLAQLANAGWVGVDMFFTLSGFLITSILLRTREKPGYFKNFYMRRALRILPLYFTLILTVFIFAPKLDPEFRSQFFNALPVLLLFQQNWTVLFLNVPITGYLWVTWSLAVEEQFYFIWPLVVYRLRKEMLLKFGLAFIALSILARILGIMFLMKIGRADIFSFFFYNSFTRFEQLVIGSLLAILLTNDELKEKIRAYSLSVFFISFFGFLSICILSPVISHPIQGYVPLTIAGYTLSALFTAGLIAACVTYPGNTLIRRLFRNRVLIFFGKYSYSMYLFHIPFALAFFSAFREANMRGVSVAVVYIGLVFTLTAATALLTWNLIESPMLNLKKYFEYK
jgi:peptidoglycan/LPS O-acetylase OafA/YrhL